MGYPAFNRAYIIRLDVNKGVKDLNRLAGQTLVYGLGTMLPRFLNYALLTPFYTAIFIKSEYGIVTELYAYMALLLVVLTYGMETGYFRFAQKSDRPEEVFGTSLISLFFTSLIFILLFNVFIEPVSVIMRYEEHKIYLRLFSLIVAIDAFTAIPFAKLRRDNRPLRFSLIKIINVTVIVGLALFYYLLAPSLYEEGNEFVRKIYNPDFGVGYVFVANLAGSVIMLLCLLPEILGTKLQFSADLWKKMIIYSFPLLISGLAGIINDALDKVILRRLVDSDTPLAIVGEYGAGYKIAVLMALFIQMYRFAMEPFFFEKASGKDARETYATTMKYFVIYALILFLALNLYISVIQLILPGNYRNAMFIVPIVSMAYLLYGIFVNLSIWYKANDLTKFGAYLTIMGAIVTIAINIIFIPKYSYLASAWAHVACYGTMIAGSYLLSRKYYQIPYEKARIIMYLVIAVLIVVLANYINYSSLSRELGFNTLFILGFVFVAEYSDKAISVFFRRKKKL